MVTTFLGALIIFLIGARAGVTFLAGAKNRNRYEE